MILWNLKTLTNHRTVDRPFFKQTAPQINVSRRMRDSKVRMIKGESARDVSE